MTMIKAFSSFFKHRPAETIPVIGVTLLGVAGCATSLAWTWGPRNAQWTVAGRFPELKITEGQQTKLMTVNQKYSQTA
ncbi:hypothetical protein SARC_01687 [Sphaeroforma arctica JP610]|uniref:Uncharacterized protein n=1 Tax=Sphaeroforma arctica JP610 TaxID=667725 RepID=A0A0L0GB96_9EUKA|nr:hypothetical protein SARC_01687 [Sphaeroforma arctica JP610]KNC86161.1 hypothetical protein SARC_01687 [Sphaeroforma arctica JP610]|eukprot:XP_014160063.1 hypothetical protein SARC_01687 [Sphaeroforma arctica JP610]